MVRIFKFVLLACVAIAPLAADQFAYIDPEVARRAVELLAKEKEIYLFCEPCNETQGQLTKVEKLEAVDVNYQGFHEVQVNGQGIDLAYTFIMRNNRWRNAAIELGLKPSGVSAEIPPIKPPARKPAAY